MASLTRPRSNSPRLASIVSTRTVIDSASAAITRNTFGLPSGPAASKLPPTSIPRSASGNFARARENFKLRSRSPNVSVEVRARVESFLDKILFKEGEEVQAGAPLFELDKKPYVEKLDAAKGKLAYRRVDTAAMRPIARLGYSEYALVKDVFRMRRPD